MFASGYAGHVLGHLAAHVRGHLDSVPGIAHGVVDAVVLAGVHHAVDAHVDQTSPAVVDLGTGQLGEDVHHGVAEDLAALLVGLGVGHREPCSAAEEQAVVGGDAEVVQEVLGVRGHPSVGQEVVAHTRVERLGGDDEAADRSDADLVPAEGPAGVCPRRQEDLIRLDPASRGLELVAGAELGQLQHGRLLVDRHAGALGGLAEPPDVLAHVEAGALRLDHSAVEGVGSDLATQLALGDQWCLHAHAGVQQLGGLLESLEVRRLGRKDQLAGPAEVAVDAAPPSRASR